MNRRSFLSAATVGAIGIGAPISEKRLSAWSDAQPESTRRITLATQAGLALQRRDWEQGVFAQAMLESGQRKILVALTRSAMAQQTADGRMAVVGNGGPTDPAMGGAAYAEAAKWTSDPEMQKAVSRMLEWILRKAPRNGDGVLYHTFEAPQMWSDGINGAPPFLAALGNVDEALKQIEGYKKVLFDPAKKLMAHIWDDGKKEFADAGFWGGGNGWTAAGLARVIHSLPSERNRDRDRLAEFATAVIDGCLAHQREDGLFHDYVDRPGTFVETNLAQMLAFSIYRGVADGWLPKRYQSQADTMRAAARKKMDEHGFVLGACGAPNFDSPGISTEAQAFCIMMEAAGQALES